jgi:hypothetical protein
VESLFFEEASPLKWRGMQQTPCNRPHAADNVQQTTCSRPHAADNMQQTTCSRQHAADNMQQMTCNHASHSATDMQ